MEYRFAREREDFSDFASGRVFYGLPGHPAFPVRLASEIFQRCVAVRRAVRRGEGLVGRCVLYDPCCGGGYLLAVLAYLHWGEIGEVIGSDVDGAALTVAERNLSLLTVEGLERRIAAVEEMWAAYGKESHREALASGERFRGWLKQGLGQHVIGTRVVAADATDGETLFEKVGGKVDVVLTDVPYGWRSEWQVGLGLAMSPVEQMLEAVRPVLGEGAVVAITADKGQKIGHGAYRRVERFVVGKRQVVLLEARQEAD